MLPLLLPWIVITLVIVAFILLLWKKWRVGVTLFVFAIVVNWWSECFPFRLWPLHDKENPYNIKVLTFNIKSSEETLGDKINKIADIVGKNTPDIIYLSELSRSIKPLLDSLLVKDYPYSLYNDLQGFYSKYSLSERIALGLSKDEERYVLKCLAVKEEDTIALFGCHLASNNYTEELKYITPDSITGYSTFIQYFNDIKFAYQKRISVAGAITRDISKRNNSIIVLGDMNDVGGSKTIRQIESRGLKDAWWEGGFGYGATIHEPLPYRIDHILYSKQLKLNNVKVVSSEGLSDHDAVFAEFNL